MLQIWNSIEGLHAVGQKYFLYLFFLNLPAMNLDWPFVLLFWDNMKNKGEKVLIIKSTPLTNVQRASFPSFKSSQQWLL